ncbi:MAG TPA: ATP-binding cassette domain-containing protein [Stellaceae bacterium]|jgi:branched-chain amino acid transport system ATP-binding protein|nr:ATP-binding cassette domain-containing protein [Stellaceae bacterium]
MALLEISGLSKRFGAVVVADAVDVAVDVGECLGVIGPNGAGKSSLFNMVAGTLRPDAGAIRFDGREVTRLPAFKRARAGIVRAFQIPQPFPKLTVYENLLVAAQYGAGLTGGAAESWAVTVLRDFGLADKAEILGGRLALLDRKRLELAKAVASRARLLLLDEIAGGLTEREVEELAALIVQLKHDHAVIWIEHIAHALRAASDRIVLLHFGKKLLDGPPAAVLNDPVVKQIYMGLAADEAA